MSFNKEKYTRKEVQTIDQRLESNLNQIKAEKNAVVDAERSTKVSEIKKKMQKPLNNIEKIDKSIVNISISTEAYEKISVLALFYKMSKAEMAEKLSNK